MNLAYKRSRSPGTFLRLVSIAGSQILEGQICLGELGCRRTDGTLRGSPGFALADYYA